MTTKRADPIVVAVDGPAGSGKSSVCAQVAKRLSWNYVNTGAIYRALGLVLASKGIEISSESAIAPHVDAIIKGFSWDGERQRLSYNGEDLTDKLGSNSAGANASLIAKMPEIRKKLVDIQRQLALSSRKGAIVDGRDIGTVIFPDAVLKLFMTASLDERAKRRMHQLGKKSDVSLDELKNQIASRDGQDSTRDAAPLKRADDAVEFDTTGMNLDEAVESLIEILRERELIR